MSLPSRMADFLPRDRYLQKAYRQIEKRHRRRQQQHLKTMISLVERSQIIVLHV